MLQMRVSPRACALAVLCCLLVWWFHVPWNVCVLVGMVGGAPFLLFFLLADKKARARGEGGEGSAKGPAWWRLVLAAMLVLLGSSLVVLLYQESMAKYAGHMDYPHGVPYYPDEYEYDVNVVELLVAMVWTLCMALVPALFVLDRKLVLPLRVWIILSVAALLPFVQVATLRPPLAKLQAMAEEAERKGHADGGF